MAEIAITSPQGETRTFPLDTAPVVLGRDPSCDIPLDDLGTSRRHIEIRCDDGSYHVQDLGSKNGTYVNDAFAHSARLHCGDVIVVGSVRIVFHSDASSQSSQTVVIDEDTTQQYSKRFQGPVSESDLSQRRLEVLYTLTDRLTRLRDRNDLLNDSMDVCFEMLRFERGAIAIRHATSKNVEWPVVRNLRGTEGELKVSRTILSAALTHGERVIVNESDDAMIDPTISMVQNNIRSAMCVPLLSEDQNLGVIYGDRVTSGTTYSKEDIDFLAGIARLVTTGLINSRLMEEQRHRLALEAEIAMAREIQTGLFPEALPQTSAVRVAALNHPGNHVSGDYYDFIALDDDRVAFIIADVTGEGVAASLLMANLQAAVRLTIHQPREVGSLLTEWNTLIERNTDASKFITCILGVVDPTTRQLSLGIGGHHMPHVVRPGGKIEDLEAAPDFPLGVMDDGTYQSHTYELGEGPCTLVSYTDGILEAVNEAGDQFGSERVVETLKRLDTVEPEALIDGLRQDVRVHCGKMGQGDDITVIAVQLPGRESYQI